MLRIKDGKNNKNTSKYIGRKDVRNDREEAHDFQGLWLQEEFSEFWEADEIDPQIHQVGNFTDFRWENRCSIRVFWFSTRYWDWEWILNAASYSSAIQSSGDTAKGQEFQFKSHLED